MVETNNGNQWQIKWTSLVHTCVTLFLIWKFPDNIRIQTPKSCTRMFHCKPSNLGVPSFTQTAISVPSQKMEMFSAQGPSLVARAGWWERILLCWQDPFWRSVPHGDHLACRCTKDQVQYSRSSHPDARQKRSISWAAAVSSVWSVCWCLLEVSKPAIYWQYLTRVDPRNRWVPSGSVFGHWGFR